MSRRPGRGIVAGAMVAALVAGCSSAPGEEASLRTPEGGEVAAVVEVHRSATCQCCEGHERHLVEEGFGVRTVIEGDMVAYKDAHDVPQEVRSCHTALVDGYVVEGHVPQEAIDELLRTRPAVDGIALPGMPPGAPGMNGVATKPLEVVSFTDGEVEEFLQVEMAAAAR